MNIFKFVGASTAAHQVEGNNTNSDFWALEQLEHSVFKEPSLDAVDHYYRYKADIDLMANAGFNAYRFSIEWARIEPEKGKFNPKEVNHYRNVILYCRSKNIEPIVTLHHFSSPKWLISQGGWEDEGVVDAFSSYVSYLIKALGEELQYVCTINEANMGLQLQSIMVERMASMKENNDVQVGVNINNVYQKMMADAAKAFGIKQVNHFLTPRSEKGDLLICKAHEKARDIIKKVFPHIQVGLTLSLHDFQVIADGAKYATSKWDMEFMHYLPFIKDDDFIGVQNYTRKIVDAKGSVLPKDAKLTDAGYEFYPEALEHVIRKVHESLNIPILITENGIATTTDEDRVLFIEQAMQGIKNCLNDQLPIMGYLHWSLLDNFEWMLGYSQKFGLIAVDRQTQKRTPKNSLYFLGEYAKQMN